MFVNELGVLEIVYLGLLFAFLAHLEAEIVKFQFLTSPAGASDDVITSGLKKKVFAGIPNFIDFFGRTQDHIETISTVKTYPQFFSQMVPGVSYTPLTKKRRLAFPIF